ncbi:MAG: TPM domain-containing protein [Oscillospiraceae bacterium]|nr:TPM domain-containing protein [Oscillospiraceae bacterium]
MKLLKKIAAVLAAAVMCTVSAYPVYAENSDKVVDKADLLTDSDEKFLELYINEMIEKHNFGYDIVVVTVNSTDGSSAEAYADDYYDYNNYGYDSEGSGLLLLVDMGGRNWHISTKGKGILAFTDYGISQIGDEVAGYLSDGHYYDAFEKFADLADSYIGRYESSGKAYDVGNEPKDYGRIFMVSLAGGMIVAVIVCLCMTSQLKTAVKQTAARVYVKNGSMRVTTARDIFLYNTVSKTKIETDSGGHGGGGGSSTHVSSGGSTHGGGGGKF